MNLLMTSEEQRIEIAEACGWKRTNYQSASLQVSADVPFWTDGKQFCQAEHLPDYLHDLNAMHEVEKVLFDRNDWSASRYEETLQKMTTSWAWHSTAAQRAEAFLKCLGKWKE